MTSAESITRSVGAPRAAFLDFPLGHTAGKANEREEQRAILTAALNLFATLETPGEIVRLPFEWSEDETWKVVSASEEAEEESGETKDDRTERRDAPQYQSSADRTRAEEALASGGCPTCVFFDG